MAEYYSNGKLLITGEYLILDGALALALPTKLGQSLIIKETSEPIIYWTSADDKGNIWFKCKLNIESLEILSHTELNIATRVVSILHEARIINPLFLNGYNGFTAVTKLDFPRNWGLGTSSTLINNIANWANIDPYKLLGKTFEGSGYDIACAKHNSALLYKLKENRPTVCTIEFDPDFKDHLYFVYLNKKRNSRDAIIQYRNIKKDLKSEIKSINNLTERICKCKTLAEFSTLITEHENIIADLLNQPPVKEILFDDFSGAIKSLGAWGGDFVMVASKENPTKYFNSKGYNTVLPYKNLILNEF